MVRHPQDDVLGPDACRRDQQPVDRKPLREHRLGQRPRLHQDHPGSGRREVRRHRRADNPKGNQREPSPGLPVQEALGSPQEVLLRHRGTRR